ncbi:hypothetical protein DFH07DRAFT_301979 [Mycena maculata]|uniref:Transmembrane protein n=1 Tax=Mycena maculata TaxID=230809 RepID=A0AAD7HIP6_9AGAR|nr:hypothetical protein DFH07DRAFT_301979 [Mycena maculata]
MGAPFQYGLKALLSTLFWSLFFLSAMAHDPVRADNSTSSASPSQSATPSSSTSIFVASSTFTTSSSTSSSSTSTSTLSSFTQSSTSSPLTTSSSLVLPTTTSSSRSISFSPSSSASSTSSSHSTSATTAVLVATPATTGTATRTSTEVSPDLVTTAASSPSPSGSSDAQVNAASTGFWANKGAVGGTFAVVALVVVGILVAVTAVLRRRSKNRNSARDTFFDTKSPVEPRTGRLSRGASMASLGNEPMDAHSTPIPNYGGVADQYLVDTSYPPGASYVPDDGQQYYLTPDQPTQQYYPEQHAAPEQDPYYNSAQQQDPYYAQSNAYEAYNQYYTSPEADAAAAAQGNNYSVAPANNRPSLSPHPYSHPSHTGAPPSAVREFVGRDSYQTQQSIDSFYGAAGTAT